LSSLSGKFRRGSEVSLARLRKREQFLIEWVGEKNTPRAGQIGVSAVDRHTSFWSDVIQAQSHGEVAIPLKDRSRKLAGKSIATARVA
jgi:hypothetical protein